MNYVDKSVYMLKRWIDYSIDELYVCPDRPDLICYGSGYNGWGMQTHQKALAAFAVIATCSDVDLNGMKVTQEQLLDYSLKMLRYMLESHIEGTYKCLEGDKWGHTWISVLGMERVMHAIEELIPHTTEADKILLEKVMLSEADWLADCYNIYAAPEGNSGKNRPESNIWNGAFLHRTASMYPHSTGAAKYKSKAISFMVNGISVSEDEKSDVIYDGKPVSEWYIGNNFYDTYALDHHGYLNVGYMVICISNIAMYHFSCKKLGINVPEALYHHAKELWRLIKMFIANDGRLIRIGGDTRTRYCYCQDYLLPSLIFARDVLGDNEAAEIERSLVDLFYKEFVSNGDGSFLSQRCGKMRQISPIYYTRLESDKAAVLSMLINWSGIASKGTGDISPLKSWFAPSHGACAVKGERRFVSWNFRGAEGMTGLCLPRGKGDLAEWRHNLAADILGGGALNETEVISHKEIIFDGGFLVSGEVNILSKKFLAEQQKDEITAREHIVFAALPDDMTTVVLQYAVTPMRIHLRSVRGINYNIPNDVYNDFNRTYHYENGKVQAGHFDGNEELIKLDSKWVNVDDELGIMAGYGNESMNIYRPGKRQVIIKKADNMYNSLTEHLSCDIIGTNMQISPAWSDSGNVILDTSAVIFTDCSAQETQKKAGNTADNIVPEHADLIRSVVVDGNDGYTYAVISNLSEVAKLVKVMGKNELVDVLKGETVCGSVEIAGKSAVLLRTEKGNRKN